MKIKSAFLIVGTALGFSNLAQAQCPEICDNDFKNTALGFEALQHSNSACPDNTAMGYQALATNTDGNDNTAVGLSALTGLTVGSLNTAMGAFALGANEIGWDNTAIGYAALSRCTNSGNTAVGTQALSRSTTATGNTAVGVGALGVSTTGLNNTATGNSACALNTTGSNNTAFGNGALFRNTTGNNNIALGTFASGNLTTGSNNIDIGSNVGVKTESNTTRIGTKGTQTAAYIAGIGGVTVAGGVSVLIDNDGHLGTNTSSARFKEGIKPIEKSSEAILSLKPVSFRYKKELDPKAVPQFGLVAEEVAKVDPDLVARDNEGKPYTVRYEAVNAMLLNEFLKEHKKVESQAKKISELESALKQQSEQMQYFAARLKAKGL